MGKHYVPQAHLRRFECEDRHEFVWMYDKKTMKFAQVKISKVAQEPDFYEPDVEVALAKEVEHPGNEVIDKLLRREWLHPTERLQLSQYLMIMATRGPRARRKSLERLPGVVSSVVDETRKKIDHWIDIAQPEEELAARRLAEIAEVQRKYSLSS